MFKDDPNVVYSPTYTSGSLGGDGKLCALIFSWKPRRGHIFYESSLYVSLSARYELANSFGQC